MYEKTDNLQNAALLQIEWLVWMILAYDTVLASMIRTSGYRKLTRLSFMIFASKYRARFEEKGANITVIHFSSCSARRRPIP
jgi:hypothetical protein